jgi:hypothetical protein
MFHRRRQSAEENKRWTFHRDKMIRPPPVLNIRRLSSCRLGIPTTTTTTTTTTRQSPTRLMANRAMTETSMYSQFSSREDIERPLAKLPPVPQDDILSTFPIVMMSSSSMPVASPTRPKKAFPPRPRPLPERPEPLRPLPPPPPDQEDIMVQMDRMSKMTELEKNPKQMLPRINLD